MQQIGLENSQKLINHKKSIGKYKKHINFYYKLNGIILDVHIFTIISLQLTNIEILVIHI
jgi:hypothetical protein